MTWSAPIDRTRSALAVLHTPVTSAPNALAICTREHPDTARRPDDQDLLSRFDASGVAYRLQRSTGGGGYRCRLLECEVCRLRCELVLPGRCVFGEGAGARAEHLVADLEPAHVRTDRLDNPSGIRAPNTSLRRAQPESHQPHQVWLTRHGVLVTDMDPSRPNPDKQLVVGDCGLRNLRKPQYVGGAIHVLHDRLHRRYSRRRPLRVANHGSGLGLRCHELFLPIRWAVLPAVLCTRGYHTKYGSAIVWKRKVETNH